MVNFINNKLAFFFMFYFIARTLADIDYTRTDTLDSDSKLSYCQNIMLKAGIMENIIRRADIMEKNINNFKTKKEWRDILSSTLVPLCDRVQLYKEKKIEDEKGLNARILYDLSKTCNVLENYNNKQKGSYEHFMNFFLSVCITIETFYSKPVTTELNNKKHNIGFHDYSNICTFLQKYLGQVNKYHVSDFDPLCIFVDKLKNDTKKTPEAVCTDFQNDPELTYYIEPDI